VPAGASVADYSRVAFDLHLRHAAGAENESWSVVLDNLELSRAQQSWRSKSISLTATQSTTGALTWTQCDVVQLENLWPLLAYALIRTPGALARNRREGRIHNLEIKASRREADAPCVYGTRPLRRFASAAGCKVPASINSAAISASESGGQVGLDVTEGAIELPEFSHALPANRITGHLSWQREPDGWRIVAEELQIDSPDGQVEAGGRFSFREWRIADGGLEGTWNEFGCARGPRYMPAGKMPATVLHGWNRAFTAAPCRTRNSKCAGRRDRFRFRNGEGCS